MTKRFQSIYWHSGLYLQPQHFQLTDIQQQYWDHRYHQLICPFSWGMIRFELDLQSLRNQELSAAYAVLLFPDGALVDCDVNAILPPRSLHQFNENYSQPLPFYIGLRSFQPGQANVTGREAIPVCIEDIRRWTLQDNARSQRDLFSDGPDADIQTMRYHLRFFLENEIAEATGYCLLPAGVLYCQDGNFVHDDQIIVTSLSLHATKAGKKWLNDFCQTVLSKIRRLEMLKAKGSTLTKYTPDEFRTLMQILQILCRHVAVLEQYRQSEPLHPWLVYTVLQQLNAELLAISMSGSDASSEAIIDLLRTPWDHNKPTQALQYQADKFDTTIRQLLSISSSRATLQFVGEGRYLASIEHVAPGADAEIYLCLNSIHFSAVGGQPVDEESSKLCAPDQLDNLINYSLPGVPLRYVQRLPHNLSVRDDTYCFRLDANNPLWHAILHEKQAILYWLNAPADLQVELVWLGDE